MKLTTIVSTLALVLALAAGCKKKEDAPPAADKPAVEAPKTTDKTEDKKAVEPPKAPAGEVKFATEEEYMAEGKAALGKFLAVFEAAGTDCEKLAKGLHELAADPKVLAANAYEKDHPDAKKKFYEVEKAAGEKVMAAAGPAMKACENNPSVREAIEKLE